jgi:hypothetical protein
MNLFSPSDAALEGFRLTRERPGTVLAWSAVYFLGVLLIGVVMLASLDPNFIEVVKKGELTTRDPEEVGAMLAQSWPAFLLVMALTVFLFSVIMAGIYRLVLRPNERSFAHLRLGRDELRLFVVNMLLFGVGIVCLFIGFLFAAMAEQAAPVTGLLLALVGSVVVSTWLGVRLSLATPMTFAVHKLSLREAWMLTRGHFWPLLGTILLAIIFYVVIWFLITIIAFVIVQLAGGQEAIQSLHSPVAVIAFAATLAIQLLLPILQVVMIYSPLAVAYQQLHGDEPARPLRTPAPQG